MSSNIELCITKILIIKRMMIFLVGKHWKELSAYFYENRTSYECNICGTRQDLVLHKRSYKFLSLPELKKKYRGDTSKIMRFLHSYMTYLCRTCHRKVHFMGDGSKVQLEYRKLKDRELKLKKHTKKLPPKPFVRRETKTSFLGSYFSG